MSDSAFQDLVLFARTNKVDKLLSALADGAEINAVDATGRTPLANASCAQMECVDAVQVLLERGADHNIAASEGQTALMFAAWRGYLATVTRLLAAGADANLKDREGRTALDHAKAARRNKVVELLEPLTQSPWDGACVDRVQKFDLELCTAVIEFIRRAESEGRRGEIQAGEIPETLDKIIPPWYAMLISSVPLSGIGFDSSKPERGWITGGWFRPWADLARAHTNFYPEIELIKDGYFAFAGSDDGEVWAIKSAGKPDDPVFHCDLSGMETILVYNSFPEFLRQIKVTDD
jgi:hypothetical protein